MRNSISAAVLAALLAVGCNGDDEAQQPGPAANGAANGREPLPEWEGTMSLDVMDAPAIRELIERHRGKVVVVQFWSTWCEPCKRMLPELVELQKRFGTKVAAISVNTDYHAASDQPPQALEDDVRSLLQQYDARFQNIISATPDESLFAEFGLLTNGVIVYNRQGEVVERFEIPIDPDEPIGFSFEKNVEPLVRKLLAEQT